MCSPVDVAQIVKVISIAYPNWQPTAETTEVYFQLLQDVDTEELKAAVLHCLGESGRRFAPSIGEIRGAVSELRGMSANVPSAFQAWQEVLRQFSLTGSYGTPSFSHPLIERAVRQLGWRNLCVSENQTADRARFLQAYEQLSDRARKEDMLLPEVRGYIEARGGLLLEAPAEQMKRLTARLSK
jgi:hypothetical protein